MATKYCEATAGLLRVLSGATPSLTPPSPPSILGVTGGNAQLTVRYAVPVSDGGSPVTSYAVSVTPGSHVISGISPGTFTQTVAGLTNGTAYTATVTVTNAIGSTTSVPSSAVTPVAASPGTGFGGGTPGWAQIKNVTNGLPQGLSGDSRTPVTLVTAESLGKTIQSGSYRLTTAATYDSVLWGGPITITATNGPVIFRNCRFKLTSSAGGAACIRSTTVVSHANSPQCFDCDFDGGGIWADTYLGPSGTATGFAGAGATNCPNGFQLIRCYMHHFTHCCDNPTGGSVIDQCYMDNTVQWFDSQGRVTHNDNVQFFLAGSTGCQITNTYLDLFNYDVNKAGNTSNIQNGAGWFTTGSVVHDVIVDSCYMSHAGYHVRLDQMGAVDIANYVFNNNRFEINMLYGVSAARDPRVTWTNNTWNTSGTIPGGQNVVAGQLIP